MKAKTILLASLLVLAGAASGDDVATLEAGLKQDIMTLVDQVNPVDAATGARKYISFAMISDIHKCKRVAGDDAATDPVTTHWYGIGACLTEAEQSIRLLGSVASDAGLDAVVNGGDFSTALLYNGGALGVGLTEAEYTNEIWNVKAMFDQYIPASVPRFTIDGNHERNYTENGATMQMSDDAWAYVLTNFNTSASAAHAQGVDITYHRDLANAKLGGTTGHFTGNSYHLDFRRLLASGGPNVRIACVSLYDSATGGESQYRAYDAGQFYDAGGNLLDADLTPENTVMGMIAHGAEEKVRGESGRGAAGSLQCGYMNGYSNPSSRSDPWNLGTHKGLGFFGLVAAHFHFTNEKEITNNFDTQANPDNKVYASAISVASAYAVNCPSKPNSHELGTQAAYHFSIFVVDTDSKKLREIRLGGWSGTYPYPHEEPVVKLHDYNIRTASSGSEPVQTPPVLGTVTVSPAVTNATISGTITSVGSNATACDVYLAYGTSAGNLGAATKIASGATASFSYVVSNLTAATTYYYSVSVSNNAETVMGASKSGNFTTGAESVDPGPEPHAHVWGDATYVWSAGNATCTGSATCTLDSTHVTNETVTAAYAVVEAATTEAAGTGRYTAVFPGAPFATQTKDVTIPKLNPEPQPGEAIQPGETAAETRQTIQDAIDAAAPTQGTVVLGEGLFDIAEQLWVTNGVTLVGQGWTNTTIRFAGTKAGNDNRVMSISDGSVVGHLTMTGGKVDNNNKSGGGAFITDGTITWCCITNNYAIRSDGGGGLFANGTGRVRIDHTIVADNAAGTNFLAGVGGGIGIRGRDGYQVEIETCLVYGNVSGKPASTQASHGGGIAITGVASSDRFTTVVRNTIVADNVACGAAKGGGIYIDQPDTTLVNCLFSGNAADTGDGNVAFKDTTVANAVAEKTSNCLFANGTTVFGANPIGLADSVGFVAAAAGDYHLVDTSLVMDKGADYAGIGTDLDGRAYAWPPSIGCYEYGSGVRPQPEWDVPVAGGGGIKGLDDGNGGTYVTFTSIARTNATLTVGFRAARIDADGATVGLLCKEDLAAAETFVLDAVLADDGSGEATLATLTATTDRPRLFAVGICTAE